LSSKEFNKAQAALRYRYSYIIINLPSDVSLINFDNYISRRKSNKSQVLEESWMKGDSPVTLSSDMVGGSPFARLNLSSCL